MAGRESSVRVVAVNRRASHDYVLGETREAGLALTGSEIKSVRAGRVNLRDSYVVIKSGEAWLLNVHISPYAQASRQGTHDPRRTRKLLLHRHEIAHLTGAVRAKGYTLIPLRIYLKNKRAKVEIALARGKKLYDKRESIAKREAQREIERALARRRRGQE